MAVHSSPHKSSKTSQKCGEYNTVTSPTNAQSNGQAEHFVQTIKNSLTKAMEGGEDLHLAILSYITTPINHSLPSPAELLNSRKYRCLLPVQIKQQNHTHQYRNIMQTKIPPGQVLQQKHQRPTQSQDWKKSLYTTRTGYQDTSLKGWAQEHTR